MGVHTFESLERHRGHKVAVVGYGQEEIVNVSIECETCNEVLVSFDKDVSEDEVEKVSEEAAELGWGNLEECFGSKSYYIGFYNCEKCPASRPCGRADDSMKFQAFVDAGHAWLRVPLKMLARLNIAGKISGYSYMRGDYAYLEEDCDWQKFSDALKAWGVKVEYTEYYSTRSRVRTFEPYRSGTD